MSGQGAERDVRTRVLAAVGAGDITRRYGKHRWWLTEHESRTLTVAERKHLRALTAQGVVEFVGAAGYSHSQIGYFTLTRSTPPTEATP